MSSIAVRRTHLELRGPAELRRARTPDRLPRLARVRPIRSAEYRALYRLVGDRWLWRDRLAWSDEELDRHLAAPTVHVWTIDVDGVTAGYFELEQRTGEGDPATVEIRYFGLAPDWIGRGLGGWLLTRAVEESFALGGTRVVLNTCTLDGPHALPNYLARGFTIVREEEYTTEVADDE